MNIFENLFQSAWLKMSKARLFGVFGTLSVCGVFAVFSRVVGVNANVWVRLSLSFLPLFVSTTLLFALGIFLNQTYDKSLKWTDPKEYVSVLKCCTKPFLSIFYVTLPLFFVYLLSWLVLGFFLLLKEIPAIGQLLGVFLSLGPFILIFLSLFLMALTFAFLFFLTPALSEHAEKSFQSYKVILKPFKNRLLMSLSALLLAMAPLFLMLTFLIAAAFITKISYFSSSSALLIGLQWFFLMLPFNALLTPFVLYFFNFSTEVYTYLKENQSEDLLVKNS